jgi:glycosyltransferase involved in cell wall biosynthesis
MPRVSVIVCTYNRASFLEKSIGSIRTCGLSPDEREIVVVDDGSTDNTKHVIGQLAGPDLKYIYQTNHGLSTARNTGINAASGEYIAYLDSDDYWLPGVAPKMMAFLETHPDVSVIFAESQVGNAEEGYIKWTEWAGRQEFQELTHTLQDGMRVYDRSAFYRLLIRRNIVFTGAVFQRRVALDEAISPVGYFRPKLNGAGDYELYLRLAVRRGFAFCPEPLAVYLQHAAQMTTGWDKMAREFCETRRTHLASGLPFNDDEKRLLQLALRDEQFYLAYLAYDRGEYREANRRFGALLSESGLERKSLMYWAITCLPSSAMHELRSFIQQFREPNNIRVGPQPWAPAQRAQMMK